MTILTFRQNINGLGLLNYSIEPHFNINNKDVLEDLKNFSENNDIYALEDDAFIIVEDDNKIMNGNIYLIRNKIITKIN